MDRPQDAKEEEQETSESYSLYVRGTLSQVKCIAKGGMAHIFRAHQPSLDRYVVVKQLKQELSSNAETVERFRREARALASVLHQNVAHVYDFVEAHGESYILMEYIDGIDLSTVVEKVGGLPPVVAAAILLGVCKGLSYIHAHNLIHRDLKPSNIRITTHGEVKLMDFGIVMDTENQSLTRPGIMVGSPSYLSPEQVLGDAITPQADIFLLGICFYEMLTGSRPFKDEGNETVFQKIREASYVPVRKMHSQVPRALERMVERCLQRNPAKRYLSVKGLISDIEEYLGAARSSHTEDLILKYLDEEALLKSSVAYVDIDESDRRRNLISLPALFLMLALMGVGLFLGYELGQKNISSVVADHPQVIKALPKPLR